MFGQRHDLNGGDWRLQILEKRAVEEAKIAKNTKDIPVERNTRRNNHINIETIQSKQHLSNWHSLPDEGCQAQYRGCALDRAKHSRIFG